MLTHVLPLLSLALPAPLAPIRPAHADPSGSPQVVAHAAPSAAPGGRGFLPRASLLALESRRSVALAPDGAWVGWIEDGAAGPALVVWRVTDAERRVPTLPGPVVAFRFSERSDEVLAVAAVEDGAELLALDLADPAAAPRALGLRAERLAIAGASAARPDEVLVQASGRGSGVWRAFLDGRAAVREGDDPGFARLWCDGELRVRAASRWSPDSAGPDVLVARGSGFEAVADWDWIEARASGALSLSADGRTLWLVDAAGRDRSALVALDTETLERRVVFEDPLADLVPAGATVDPVTGDVEAVVSYWGALRRRVLDPAAEPDLERGLALLEATLPGDLSWVDRSRDGSVWLVRSMDGGPMVVWVHERRTGRTRRVFGAVPELEGAPLAARHAVAVPARDGLAIPAALYLPRGCDADADGVPDEPLPAVLYVHGGPWIGMEWNSWFTNRSFQLLADRGYAVLRVDFRGAGGYGRAWMDAGDGEFGAAMIDDVVDAARWAVERGVAAEGRIALWGWSYGGYAAFQALARSPATFACGISMYGLADLDAFVRRLVALGGGGLWMTRVGDPHSDEGAALLREQSPLFHVERIAAPLLVTHGALDDRVPIEFSERMVEALAAAGKQVTYSRYPDEPHDYRAQESWISFWAIAEHFLAQHLGGRAAPWGDDLARGRFELVTGAERVEGLLDALGPGLAHDGR